MKILKAFKKSFLITVMLVICLSFGFLSACVSVPKATYIKLNTHKAIVRIGDTFTLIADTDGEQIEWVSDATHIATVNGGVVTAVAVGEATIKARVGKLRAYCDVTVVDRYPVVEGNICDLYDNYFVIGAAVQSGKLDSEAYGNLLEHFNSITPENNMKWKNVEKVKGVYNFDQSGDSADKLISWAKRNGVGVRGHCLLWYKSLPEWLHNEFDGRIYTEELKNKAYSYIDEHIETVMKHFGDDVYVWDVCNEALLNSISQSNLDASEKYPYGYIWRTNDNMNASSSDWVDWYRVTGGYEYIARAFKKADEVRKANNLDVQLFYNDYSLNQPSKRQACLNLIKMLRDHDAPIDGIGMQAHYWLDNYLENKTVWLENFEASIKSFIEAGVDVQITELDIRFNGALTEEKEKEQAELYGKIFAICRKYAKTEAAEHGVTGITTWGVQDGSNGAWGKDTFPLIFGSDKLPKKAYYEIIDFN